MICDFYATINLVYFNFYKYLVLITVIPILGRLIGKNTFFTYIKTLKLNVLNHILIKNIVIIDNEFKILNNKNEHSKKNNNRCFINVIFFIF